MLGAREWPDAGMGSGRELQVWTEVPIWEPGTLGFRSSFGPISVQPFLCFSCLSSEIKATKGNKWMSQHVDEPRARQIGVLCKCYYCRSSAMGGALGSSPERWEINGEKAKTHRDLSSSRSAPRSEVTWTSLIPGSFLLRPWSPAQSQHQITIS